MGKGRSLVQEMRRRSNNEFIVWGKTVKINCFLSTFVLQAIKFTPLGDLLNTELFRLAAVCKKKRKKRARIK